MADSSSVTVDLTGITTLEELADVLNRSRDVQGNAHNFRSMGFLHLVEVQLYNCK